MEFGKKIEYLSLQVIEEINKNQDTVLNNVLEGFQKQFFAISFGGEENNLEDYALIYVGNYDGIRGLCLRNGRSLENRNWRTWQFSMAIENEFKKPNQLVMFNTFQQKQKELYEKFGVMCMPEYIVNAAETHDMTLILGHKKGVDYLPKVDILEFYKSFFERTPTIENLSNIDKVYLMYDVENTSVKIGKTKTPIEVRRKGVAEPTLRAVKQEIYPIVAWQASQQIETDLKAEYREFNQRGEWFDLRPRHLQQINKKMSKYEIIHI